MEETPLKRTEKPPPGAPLFALICAPEILPCIAPSRVTGRVEPVNCFALIVPTEFARFERFILVAKPLTTTSDNLEKSSESFINNSEPVSCTVFVPYPTKVTVILLALFATLKLKLPSRPETVLFLLMFSKIVAPSKGLS